MSLVHTEVTEGVPCVFHELDDGMACAAYEFDEEWDEVLLLLEIEAAEAMILAAEVENDEAIARCLAEEEEEQRKNNLRISPKSVKKSYLQAAQSQSTQTIAISAENESIPTHRPRFFNDMKHDEIDKMPKRKTSKMNLQMAALEKQSVALRSRVEAIRSLRSIRSDSTSILARDRAQAQLLSSRKHQDAAAALTFIAHNERLFCSTLDDPTFIDALNFAVTKLKHTCDFSQPITIDLHHLTVANAKLAVTTFLDALATKDVPQSLKIVAGRGMHSSAGVPRLAPAIRRHLELRASSMFSFREEPTGTFWLDFVNKGDIVATTKNDDMIRSIALNKLYLLQLHPSIFNPYYTDLRLLGKKESDDKQINRMLILF